MLSTTCTTQCHNDIKLTLPPAQPEGLKYTFDKFAELRVQINQDRVDEEPGNLIYNLGDFGLASRIGADDCMDDF